jgi:peptide/nickel transport system substrate-binding protein
MKKVNSLYLLAFLVVASLVMSACGPANNAPANNDTANNAANNAANDAADNTADDAADDMADDDMAAMGPEFKNPDTYVVLTTSDPETLDPAWTYETMGSSLENNIYESMVWFNRERNDLFVPVLATDWTISDDGTVWVFNVREGVQFHEGGTLEPHDVAYSLQRAMLQDRTGGPHWMSHEAFFGTYSMYGGTVDLFDGDAAAACEAVKSAIVADDEAGTITYTLAAPTPWFLALLANSFIGNVLDMEWMVEQGAWDGSCDTWEAFNDPAPEDTVIFNVANGTGPYVLDHWTPGEEIVMYANENYWRADGDPIWEGGPSGVASIKNVIWQIIPEWGTRLAIFEAGDADVVGVPPAFYSQVEDNYGDVTYPDGSVENMGGWMQIYTENVTPAMTPAQFNWLINSEGGNNFQGSGKLDGNGIPDDFFQDINIRRAFSYCFDYDTMINEVLDGQGVQAQGPIIAGMLGYRDDGFVFSYDPDKCIEEFQASETGVWDTGFYMQLGYNTGNDTRRLAGEILKAGIEAVNPGFQIQVVGMPWPVLLSTRRAGKLPIYVGGWLEDFHDPHNWVHPFLHSTGAYGAVANIQEPARSEFDSMIEEAASLTNVDDRRPIYEAIQLKAQTDAAMIWLYQPLSRIHLSPFIEGFYFNAAYSAASTSYIYALAKVGP